MLIGFYLLSFLGAHQYREERFKIANPNLQIGTLVTRQNDVRHRQRVSNEWGQAEHREKISLGDSLYVSEKSHATVQFREGGVLEFGENSLAHFQQIENEKIPRLVCGNFLLHVDESLRIKIGGEITTFEGKGGEVQVFLALNQKPQFKTLHGIVTVRNKKDATVPAPDAEDTILCPDAGVQNYVWRLYDLYEQREMTLAERDPQPTSVFANYPITWIAPQGTEARIQLSSTENFAAPLEFVSSAGRFNFPKLNSGANYWRVSTAPKTWSAPQKIVVRPHFLAAAAPQLETPVVQVPLFQQTTTIEMKMKAPIPTVGFVAQASLTESFTPETTRTFWSPHENLRLSFYKEGVYFYRFRSVSQKQELSEWSATQKFEVVTPRLAEHKTPKRKRARPQPSLAAKEEVREPTSIDTSTILQYPQEVSLERRNVKYSDTRISMEGFLWTLQSSQQYYQSQTNPVASGVGVNLLSWWGTHGFESTLKSGIMGLNATGKQTALRDFENRYHYRFVTGFPFNLARELQTSFFVGYEMYRNTGDSFSNQYDLIKFGTSLEFPLAANWSTGGEFVYGMGTEKSNKKEISGHLSYFFNHDWSAGAGYRLHLFEAGSASAAPAGLLPYREGYTEGYSILNYHF